MAEKKRRRSKGNDAIVRVEDIEKILEENGQDLDPEAVISMYRPNRRIKRFGAALLRLDKIKTLMLALVALVVILFVVAFTQEQMGNFTINLDRLELYRRGINIAADGNFTDPTARLTAGSLQDATNTTLADLPADLDEIDGDHNGRNYVAYTYYVRNSGKETVNYKASVELENASKGAEKAVRVAVWKNGERTIYAAPAADGGAEPECETFVSDTVACVYEEEAFEVGFVDKYTVVIWLEGEDPECTDEIVGGSLQFKMNIDAIEDSDTGLLAKMIKDIKDRIRGNTSIGVGGADSGPDYYKDSEITWETRRNQ